MTGAVGRPEVWRSAALALTGLLVLAAGLFVLLAPFGPGLATQQTCGNALVRATPPTNDDSWFSECADKRSTHRDDGSLLTVIGAIATLGGAARAVAVQRSVWL